MARDATARLYDVDANSVVMNKKEGTIVFWAKKGKLVDLDTTLREDTANATVSLGYRTGDIPAGGLCRTRAGDRRHPPRNEYAYVLMRGGGAGRHRTSV